MFDDLCFYLAFSTTFHYWFILLSFFLFKTLHFRAFSWLSAENAMFYLAFSSMFHDFCFFSIFHPSDPPPPKMQIMHPHPPSITSIIGWAFGLLVRYVGPWDTPCGPGCFHHATFSPEFCLKKLPPVACESHVWMVWSKLSLFLSSRQWPAGFTFRVNFAWKRSRQWPWGPTRCHKKRIERGRRYWPALPPYLR